MAIYKGYSSYEFQNTKQFSIVDVELVKLDLLNHIYTRLGSRVMMPTFGTVIPELLMEPLDEDTTDILEDELRRVIAFDPRVELVSFSLDVNHDGHAVTARMQLFYIELGLVDPFDINLTFEQ